MNNLRAEAARCLSVVLEGGRSVESCLDRVRHRYPERDLRLLRELISGGVRWLRFLDSVIERAAKRPRARIEPRLLDHLRIGAYQILFLDRVPAHAAVHEAVELAKRTAGAGAGRFVNAVLRTIGRRPDVAEWLVATGDPIADLAVNQSHPEALLRGWVEQFGEVAARAVVDANNRPKRGLGVLARDRERLASVLTAAGAEVAGSTVSPLALVVSGIDPDVVIEAGGYIQDQASQAAALVPWPQPQERVFDAAAAPGGKALALVAAEPRVRILAADLRLDRLPRLVGNMDRRGFKVSVSVLAADVLCPAIRAESFDRVVFDAPCSGSGTLRKHPELKWRIDDGEIARLADLQLTGLRSLVPLVRPGGRLCYITCSIENRENEDVVEAFLSTESGWLLEVPTLAAGVVPAFRAPGSADTPSFWRLLPAAEHDGATVHVLRRVEV